jgi:hypothetical protein
MERISWDIYKSVVRNNVSAGITVDTMFGKRTDMDNAAKAAKKILEGVAKKFNVDYEQLIKTLLGKI